MALTPSTFTRALLPAGLPSARSGFMITAVPGARRSSGGRPPPAGSRSGPGALPEQVVGDDRLQGQRLVADLLEQDDDAVVLVPHDDAGTPLGVLDGGVDREGVFVVVDVLFVGRSGAAVVAVATWLLELLAEVAEQQLAAATGRLGVAAHHLDPALVDPLVVLGELAGRGRGIPRCGRVGCRRGRPVVVQDDGAGLLQQVQV